jgi:hemolysin activation/secretion protein
VGDTCPLTAAHLERAELLLQDEPGVSLAPASLSPEGVSVGQTAVGLTTASNQPLVSGFAGVDNYGIPASGMNRLGGGVVLTDLLHDGDVFALSGITTNRHENAGSLSGSLPIFSNGWRAQASYTRTLYSLPQVGATGAVNTMAAGVSYPLWRGLSRNWTVAFDGLDSTARETVAGYQAFSPRHIVSGRATLSANAGDRPMDLGQSYWSGAVAWEHGQVSQSGVGHDPAGQLGHFDKLTVNALGKLNLTADQRWYLLGTMHGQWASHNLDASEAMQLGGQAGVRAYRADEGELDSGMLASVELHRMFVFSNGDRLSVGPIVDYGNGRINQHPFTGWQVASGYSDATMSNHRTLTSAGLGADWVSSHGYTVSMTWSHHLPGSSDSVNHPGSADGRIFASVTFKF